MLSEEGMDFITLLGLGFVVFLFGYIMGTLGLKKQMEEKDKSTIRPDKEVFQTVNPSVIMTVVYIENENANCVWENEFGIQRGYFPLNSLELYIKPQS